MQGARTRLEVVVRFLAVLELFKQGFVDLEQVTTFGELQLRRLDEGEDAALVIDLTDWDEEDVVVGEGVVDLTTAESLEV